MGWFQRYGIGGTYFCGLCVVRFAGLYHCQFSEIITCDLKLKIAAGVLAGSFLPVGYLVSVFGQIVYHLIPGIGIDTRARRCAGIRFHCSWASNWLEYIQEAITVHQIMTTTAFSLNKMKWLLQWMSKRMDMIVINLSIVLGTIIAPLAVWLFPKFFGLNSKIDPQWVLFASIVSAIVLVLSSVSWGILTSQLVRVETEVLRRMVESRA